MAGNLLKSGSSLTHFSKNTDLFDPLAHWLMVAMLSQRKIHDSLLVKAQGSCFKPSYFSQIVL